MNKDRQWKRIELPPTDDPLAKEHLSSTFERYSHRTGHEISMLVPHWWNQETLGESRRNRLFRASDLGMRVVQITGLLTAGPIWLDATD